MNRVVYQKSWGQLLEVGEMEKPRIWIAATTTPSQPLSNCDDPTSHVDSGTHPRIQCMALVEVADTGALGAIATAANPDFKVAQFWTGRTGR